MNGTPSNRALETNSKSAGSSCSATGRWAENTRKSVAGTDQVGGDAVDAETAHRGWTIVRLRLGLTPLRARNFVRYDPIRSSGILLTFAYCK